MGLFGNKKETIELHLKDDCPKEDVQRFIRYFNRNKEFFDNVNIPKKYR